MVRGLMGEFYDQRSLGNALEDLYAHYYIKVSEKFHIKELFYFIYFCGSERLSFLLLLLMSSGTFLYPLLGCVIMLHSKIYQSTECSGNA